jgi:hypothetical protein
LSFIGSRDSPAFAVDVITAPRSGSVEVTEYAGMRARTVLCLFSVLSLQATVCAESTPSPAPPADAARRALDAASRATPSPELLAAVQADAARTLRVTPDRIAIVASEAVVWPDGGLGCARPDEMVTTVQTPGFRLRVQARGDERELVYHTNRRSYFRLCPGAGRQPLPPPTLPDR